MPTVPIEHLQRTILILGEGERRSTEIDIAVGRFVPDRMVAKRMIEWIPEAFGLVMLPDVADVVMPTTFTARTRDGAWKEFAFGREPILADALRLATEMYRAGTRGAFSHIVQRSVLIASVNDALNAGRSLKGAKIPGPALAGIPAEIYEEAPAKPATSLWRKLVG